MLCFGKASGYLDYFVCNVLRDFEYLGQTLDKNGLHMIAVRHGGLAIVEHAEVILPLANLIAPALLCPYSSRELHRAVLVLQKKSSASSHFHHPLSLFCVQFIQ